jgi:hypothetical protein
VLNYNALTLTSMSDVSLLRFNYKAVSDITNFGSPPVPWAGDYVSAWREGEN